MIASCNKAMSSNVTDVENEMIAFFQKTLEHHFGEKDPLMSMMKAWEIPWIGELEARRILLVICRIDFIIYVANITHSSFASGLYSLG